MTTETDTAKAVSTAKGGVTKAEKALADAMASQDMDATMKASAALQSAQGELAKAERAHEAATREEYVEQIGDATSAVKTALSAAADSIEILRRAGIKYVDIEVIGEGNYTVSTRSGKRGVQPGTTRNVERYEIEVAGKPVEFTAGNLIKNFGETMSNYDARMEQISNKELTRKEFAREICEALSGTVVGGNEE